MVFGWGLGFGVGTGAGVGVGHAPAVRAVRAVCAGASGDAFLALRKIRAAPILAVPVICVRASTPKRMGKALVGAQHRRRGWRRRKRRRR